MLLDTNILVAFVRGSGTVHDAVQAAYGLTRRGVRPAVCAVSLGELLSLARKLGWSAAKLTRVRGLSASVQPLDICSRAVLDAYAEIDHYTERMLKPARPMGKNDLWIAATAKAHGFILLTADSDFDHLHGRLITRHFIDPTDGRILT